MAGESFFATLRQNNEGKKGPFFSSLFGEMRRTKDLLPEVGQKGPSFATLRQDRLLALFTPRV
jgi:hypothetical protein